MVKQLVIFLLLSVLVIFFKDQLVFVLHALVYAHQHVLTWLSKVFAMDMVGRYIQTVVALIAIPAFASGLVAAGSMILKKRASPQVIATLWLVWTVLLVTILAKTA